MACGDIAWARGNGGRLASSTGSVHRASAQESCRKRWGRHGREGKGWTGPCSAESDEPKFGG